jgi:CDP-4-dehydro-6-deoxyglucose reductase
MFTVTVIGEEGKNQQITCYETESLLDAANRQGVKIPYACKGGGCGLCKIKVEEGEFERKKSSIAVLPEEERKMNFALACKTYPKSHIKLSTDLSKVSNPL